MNKVLRYIFVYLAWIMVFFVFLNMFIAGTFGVDIIMKITKTVVWHRVVIALLGVVGLWYVIFDRFIHAKGKC